MTGDPYSKATPPRALRHGGSRWHGLPRIGFVGDEVSCYGQVIRAGRTSITTSIEAWRRNFATGVVRKVTEAIFTYVAIGENRRPRPLPPPIDSPPPQN